MSTHPSESPTDPGLDVSLEDPELRDELGLLSDLMVALNRVDCGPSPRELDEMLGL
jgi:hypothetical protein